MNINTMKEYHEALANLKIGDMVFVHTSRTAFVDGKYQLFRVAKVTATRITVTNEYYAQGLVFTKDGFSYPKEKGYGGSKQLLLRTEENNKEYRNNLAQRRVKYLNYKLYEILRQDHGRLDKITEMESRNLADVLERYVAILDKINLNEVPNGSN